jgi:hypothetical protein
MHVGRDFLAFHPKMVPGGFFTAWKNETFMISSFEAFVLLVGMCHIHLGGGS